MRRFVFVIIVCMGFGPVNDFCHDGGPPFEKSVLASSTLTEEGKKKETYAPWRVFDCDNNTAWVEGKDNEGIGEWLLFGAFDEFSNICGVEILPGIAASEKLFKMNNRPKKILLEYETLKKGVSPYSGEYYVSFCKELVLKDENRFQRFMFNKSIKDYVGEYDKKNAKETNPSGSIRFTIKEVYKGSKYNDTAISEIRFLDKSGKIIDPYAKERKFIQVIL
jgi:hypothetical protein